MLSLHPTISLTKLISYLLQPNNPHNISYCLQQLFPGKNTLLTDSGRSAFAMTIEALQLQNTTMVLPAYVCDAFYPLLLVYNIKPIFIDVDSKTFQPPLESYTDRLMAEADSFLLVATYGRKIDECIINLLKAHKKIIIEDYSMRSPLLKEPLTTDARIYSLPKTLPVPDGGLAVLQNTSKVKISNHHKTSISYIKNVLKLLPGVALLIACLRDFLKSRRTSASWSGIHDAKTLTKKIIKKNISSISISKLNTTYTYCLPIKVTDPARAVKKLRRHGIQAERIWHRPIVTNQEVRATYNIDLEKFPSSTKLASQIICLPLWHIKDDESLKNYQNTLHKVLGNFISDERI